MHEYGITAMLVERIINIARKEGANKVLQVNIEIGEFSFLNPEQMKFCYSTLVPKTILEESVLILKKTKGTVRCNSCEYQGPIHVIKDSDVQHTGLISYACPDCSQMTQIVDGKSCTIKGLKFST